MSFFIGDKVLLRPVEGTDLDGPYAEWINLQEADTFTEHAQFPHSRENLERYLEERPTSDNYIWLAIIEKESNRHIGNVDVSNIDWVHRKARYSIIIGDSSVLGKGFGYEASKLLLSHAFRKLNLHRIELGVHENNTAAHKLYKKLGFVEEGRLREAFIRNGEYHDLIIMGLLADEIE